MKKLFLSLILSKILFSAFSQGKVLPPDLQIKLALLSAPAEKKDSAAVYGYSSSRELILLRKGLYELICLAEDPNQPGFSVA